MLRHGEARTVQRTEGMGQQRAVCTQPVLLCMYEKRLLHMLFMHIYLVNAWTQYGGSADRVKNRFVHENFKFRVVGLSLLKY